MPRQNGTFWDENRNFENSTTQHQHLAPRILGRSSRFPLESRLSRSQHTTTRQYTFYNHLRASAVAFHFLGPRSQASVLVPTIRSNPTSNFSRNFSRDHRGMSNTCEQC